MADSTRKQRKLTNTEMLMMRLDGATYAAIAQAAGISRQRVQQILRPPPGIRKQVVDRYAGRCVDCGIHVGHTGHIHHKDLSIELGQWNDQENLELLCITCHLFRHRPEANGDWRWEQRPS